jgi:hypothetical protein
LAGGDVGAGAGALSAATLGGGAFSREQLAERADASARMRIDRIMFNLTLFTAFPLACLAVCTAACLSIAYRRSITAPLDEKQQARVVAPLVVSQG